MKRTLFTSILATALGVAAVTLASIAPAAANSDAGTGTLAASATYVSGVGSTYTFDVEINARGYVADQPNHGVNIDISEWDGSTYVPRHSQGGTTSKCYHAYGSYQSTCGSDYSNLQTVIRVNTPMYSCFWRVRVSGYWKTGAYSDHTRDVTATHC